MTVTVPSSAVDMKTIMATVYVLDVTGAEVKKDVQLTVAQSTPAEDETVAAVGMKVMYPDSHSLLIWALLSLTWMLYRPVH